MVYYRCWKSCGAADTGTKGYAQAGCDRHVCIFISYAAVLPDLGFSGANPAYTAGELQYQLEATKAKLLITSNLSYPVAIAAAMSVGLPLDHIVLFDPLENAASSSYNHATLHELVKEGLGKPQGFTERKLERGEGKTKLAFLSFSSGTTGKPKVLQTLVAKWACLTVDS